MRASTPQAAVAAVFGLALMSMPVGAQKAPGAGPDPYPYINERQPVRPYNAPQEVDPRDVENIALRRSMTILEDTVENLLKRVERLERLQKGR